MIRIIQTIINFSIFLSMFCLGFSGVVMSRHVFAGFPICGPMATARSVHMAASYWGFVLMEIHSGLHWGVLTGRFRNFLRGRKFSYHGILNFYRILHYKGGRRISAYSYPALAIYNSGAAVFCSIGKPA